MTSFCTKCGNEIIQPGGRFCSFCGGELPEQAAGDSSQDTAVMPAAEEASEGDTTIMPAAADVSEGDTAVMPQPSEGGAGAAAGPPTTVMPPPPQGPPSGSYPWKLILLIGAACVILAVGAGAALAFVTRSDDKTMSL